MKQEYKARLRVNDSDVELNPFVEEFLARTVYGAVASLKHPEDIEDLELSLEHGDVSIFANGSEVPLTAFPQEMIANTFVGLVSSLKGIEKVTKFKITVRPR